MDARYNPIYEDILATLVRSFERNDDEHGIADAIMARLSDLTLTVDLALLTRVRVLEDAVRRLCDAAYTIADHARAYDPGDVVLEGRRLGSDDGLYPVGESDLRELAEAIAEGEEAFLPEGSGELLDRAATVPQNSH